MVNRPTYRWLRFTCLSGLLLGQLLASVVHVHGVPQPGRGCLAAGDPLSGGSAASDHPPLVATACCRGGPRETHHPLSATGPARLDSTDQKLDAWTLDARTLDARTLDARTLAKAQQGALPVAPDHSEDDCPICQVLVQVAVAVPFLPVATADFVGETASGHYLFVEAAEEVGGNSVRGPPLSVGV